MRPVPLIAFLSVALGLSMPAHAYLDPGTGSILLQGLIAAIASVGFYAKTHWQAIKAYFNGDNKTEDDAGAGDTAEETRD